MKIEDLTLPAIDGMRHLTVSQDLVTAIAFAARSGYDDTTCYRFVTAIIMTDRLTDHTLWLDVLKRVKRLEKEEE